MADGLDTGDLQDQLNEAMERAEAAGEAKAAAPKWITVLSLMTAVIAVMAAIASLEAGSQGGDALMYKNNAVLAQAKASDQWAYYQAKGIKGVVYKTQAQMLAFNPKAKALAEDFTKEADHYKAEQADIKKQAEDIEKQIQGFNKQTDVAQGIGDQFSLSVTLFQVAIALSAIAGLMRKKLMWYVGLLISCGGLWYFIHGLLLMRS